MDFLDPPVTMDEVKQVKFKIKDEISKQIYDMFKPLVEITQEDLDRKFTDIELKQLCQLRKCRVEAGRWNAVDDWNVHLRKIGRFEGRSLKYQLGMLTKAIMKYKDNPNSKTLYSDEEIKSERRNNWIYRKKDSINSLNVYYNKENKKKRQIDAESMSTIASSQNTLSSGSDANNNSNEILVNNQALVQNHEVSSSHSPNLFLMVHTESMQLLSADVNTEEVDDVQVTTSEKVDDVQVTTSQDIFTPDYLQFTDLAAPTMTSTQTQNTENLLNDLVALN